MPIPVLCHEKAKAAPVEAAAEEEQEQEELQPLPPLVPPLTNDGEKCLVELEIPRADVVSILDQIRIEILEEMDEFAQRCVEVSLPRYALMREFMLWPSLNVGFFPLRSGCRTQAEAKEWSTIEVEELTEELDENLRRHRPRAGCVSPPKN